MKRISPLFFIIPLVIILGCAHTGCTQLVFEETMPQQAEDVQVLPAFLEGTFHDNESNFYDFERISETQCLVKSYIGITKDSLDRQIQEMNTDSTVAELKGSVLVIKHTEETELVNFTIEGDYYFSEKRPTYEINLAKGYFIDDFEEPKEKKAILKRDGGKYFLNIAEGEFWAIIGLEKSENGISITKSNISKKDFSEEETFFKGITTIRKIDGDAYVANPTDPQFYQLLGSEELFQTVEWVRVETDKTPSQRKKNLILAGVVAGFVLLIFAAAFLRKK